MTLQKSTGLPVLVYPHFRLTRLLEGDPATKSDAQHVFPATLVHCDAMSGSIAQLVSPWLANGQFRMVTAVERSFSRFHRDSSRSHHWERARKNQLQRCSGAAVRGVARWRRRHQKVMLRSLRDLWHDEFPDCDTFHFDRRTSASRQRTLRSGAGRV